MAVAMVSYDAANGVVTELPTAYSGPGAPHSSNFKRAHFSEREEFKGRALRDSALAVELLEEYKGKFLYVNDDGA